MTEAGAMSASLIADLERACANEGIKLTEQRRLVLRVLAASGDHPSAETVFSRAAERDPSISMATVYRTLNMLEQINIVRRHDFREPFARFELQGAGHYHMVDVETGDVLEFQDSAVSELLEELADDLGCELIDARLELFGRRRT